MFLSHVYHHLNHILDRSSLRGSDTEHEDGRDITLGDMHYSGQTSENIQDIIIYKSILNENKTR